RLGADLEDTQEPVVELLGGVVVRVVHAHADRGRGEFVGVRLAGLDRRLGDAGNPVHAVGHTPDPVEVDRGRLREPVGDHEADVVTDVDVDGRAGIGAVVQPRLHRLGGVDLPAG